MNKSSFGLIGLGVMGRNLLLNVADHGFRVSGLDLDPKQVSAMQSECLEEHKLEAFTSTDDFIRSLSSPRTIMLLVPAGTIVDQVIESLIPKLDKGDLIIDGGNSHFLDTERREQFLNSKGLLFLGTGVSGGAQGARKGPSIMPGGALEAYKQVAPIFEAISAKYQGEPCVSYVGRAGAGNYVKMVHNGIEYAIMQSIAEVYALFRSFGFSNAEIKLAFESFQKGRLSSFLIEITAAILGTKDPEGRGELIDNILDKAKQKGTGKWTSQNAMDLGIAIPSIDMAVSQRALSALKELRLQLSENKAQLETIDFNTLSKQAEKALYASFAIAYGQGLHQISEASKVYDYQIDLLSVIKLWRGGCIIQSEMLGDLAVSFEKEAIEHIFESSHFKPTLKETLEGLRELVLYGTKHALPVGTLSSSLSYYDALHSSELPVNLVQAQRDFFGSHTFERKDQPGIFHHDWSL